MIQIPEELYEYTKKIAKKSGVNLDKLCEGLNARTK